MVLTSLFRISGPKNHSVSKEITLEKDVTDREFLKKALVVEMMMFAGSLGTRNSGVELSA